jgi:GR25 family glycosyltransferase involved in LPS biosynthesis
MLFKIFVMHYALLKDRKKSILEQFERIKNLNKPMFSLIDFKSLDIEFIEAFDKDKLSENEKSLFKEGHRSDLISLHLKHFYAYREIASKYSMALILEDDVIFQDNFLAILDSYLRQLPYDFDMFFIGDGCNLHIDKHKILPGINVYEKSVNEGPGATRCTDSYVISNKCAARLCCYINLLDSKISLPIDWWLNVALRENDLNVYWAEPTIITQGSQNGKFKSTLRE